MTPGKRLLRLAELAGTGYQHIWDGCCDHGQLGAALLDRHAANTLHFVDIVPALMNELAQRLSQWSPQANWQCHCLDVAQLPLQHYSGRQLLIIAGVGGDLMVRMLNQLASAISGLNLELLLCPVNHCQDVRTTLRELGFGLLHEELLEENRRCYELIKVQSAPHSLPLPSLVGDDMWHDQRAGQAEVARRYMTRTQAHLQRIQAGGKEDVSPWLDALQAIQLP